MTMPTRLLFGVRATGPVSLTITATGPLPPQVPDLCVQTSGHSRTVPCCNNCWVATLDPGDHIVRLSMPAPEPPNATEVPLTLTFSAPAILVGPKDPSGTPLVTWTTMTSATGSDPKNPLPPPETDALDVSLLADSTWLRNTLTIQGAQAYVARSVP